MIQIDGIDAAWLSKRAIGRGWIKPPKSKTPPLPGEEETPADIQKRRQRICMANLRKRRKAEAVQLATQVQEAAA